MRVPQLSRLLLTVALGSVFVDLVVGQSPAPKVVPPCSRDLDAIKGSTAVLPWDADLPGNWWENRAKFYIISAVDSIRGASDAELKFAANDARLLGQNLCRLGFQPAGDVEQAILTGQDSTSTNVIRAAKAIQDVTADSEPLLILYYSGHGVKDSVSSKLSLQFWDQDDVGVADGTSFGELLTRIRSVLPHFQMVIIVDACFSGTALSFPDVSSSALDGVTLLLSSSEDQFSKPLTRPDGTQVSAFTNIILDVLEREEAWQQADSERDGLLWAEDLAVHAKAEFKRLSVTDPGSYQAPKYSAFGEPQVFAYDRSKLKNPNSSRRNNFVRVSVQAPRSTDGAIIIGGRRMRPSELRVSVARNGKELASAALRAIQPTIFGFASILKLPGAAPLTGQLTYTLSGEGQQLSRGAFNLGKADEVLLVDPQNNSLLTSHVGKVQGGAGTKLVLDKIKMF